MPDDGRRTVTPPSPPPSHPPSMPPNASSAPVGPPVRVGEVRVLDGPNLYFTRPAIKVSLHLPGYVQLSKDEALDVADRVGLRSARPGGAGTALRQRFVMRLTRTVMRRLASGIGAGRHGVKVRAGATPADVVVAFPWADRTRGRMAGEQLGEVLLALLSDGGQARRAIEAAAETILDAPEGSGPALVAPAVPVVSVTGTNGKTTTTRLLAHMCMTAGMTTAWSSTDGVVVMGRTVQAGDYSGPAGAQAVLATPGLDVGILETARGGLLLKGMGVTVNDVSVVTNVSADHLGLQGIDTLDQLAEVKAIITTVTRPGGWVVLNGEDPRVWAMRARAKAKPWAFTLDPDSPALWESLNSGGRGITVLEGEIVVLSPNGDPDRLVKVVDVPMTMSGLSRHNVANALAGTAAALGLGVPRAAVVEGLRTFSPDPVHNWGRLNTYSLPLPSGGSATVIMDMAHNEAGLEALLEVARGLTAPGGYVRLALGCAGDRPDEAIAGMGELAGRGADEVVIKGTAHYLRGRAPEELADLLRAGLARAGVLGVPELDTEVESLAHLAAHAVDGDTVAVMCHSERVEVDGWVRARGGRVDDARAIRCKVVTARGEHELEGEIAGVWSLEDPTARVEAARRLLAAGPGDARLLHEYAATLDAAGREAEAIGLYERALAAGLREPHRHRGQLQLAACLRSGGRLDEALGLLDAVSSARPGNAAALILRALVLADLGQDRRAVGDLIRALLEASADPDTQHYRDTLARYAAELAPEPARPLA
ncbi:MAG TPA: tetratricopeptide repeat protein [Intrasporangium sp.]|uniref:tetratricopeptide repeat protein n=1 Tax=Intrasporangium sp. TaxID=1925024 RepID=UPI002D79FFB9|nr:tetratricopeptide repeat protein [Intrasporangium sp.]HET7398082.1 tetratricopeptide repeat protein [Intrasporangium sp.]